jgi:hypothetical protein
MGKDFGELLSESLKEYRSNFKTILVIILLLAVLPGFIQFLLGLGIPNLETLPPEQAVEIFSNPFFYGIVVVGLIAIVLGIFMSLSLISLGFNSKKKLSFGQSFSKGSKFFWKYLLLIIMMTIFLIPLFLLLIIPGIIFMTYWAFAMYVLVDQGKGVFGSLGESMNIVKGRWWRVLGYSILVLLLYFVVALAIGIPFGIIGAIFAFTGTTAISEFMGTLAEWVITLIVSPISILFYKNFYLELKGSKVKSKKKKS